MARPRRQASAEPAARGGAGTPPRERSTRTNTTDEIARRAEQWADGRAARVGGTNPWTLVVRTARASAQDRITGLAAEMAFFALLSLVPAVVAVGAGLGWLELVLGAQPVADGRDAVLRALGTVFSPQATEEVLHPLVEGLLEQQRGGVAFSSILIALWLASRVFTATIRALDTAYNVAERRTLLEQRVLAMLFAIGAVLVVPVTLVLVVVGPLLGSGQELADSLGLGEAFAIAWSIGRWPVVFVLLTAGFAVIYRFGPNVDNRWRDCIPGAIVGVVLWLLVSAGFRAYLGTAGDPTARFAAGEEAAALLAAVGAVVAAVLWTFLSGLAVLVGGEFNAELAAERRARAQPDQQRGGRRRRRRRPQRRGGKRSG